MAIITTQKQFSFCEDIKKNILSYLCPKPMRLIDILNPKIKNLIFRWWVKYDEEQERSIFFKFRMIVSREQALYEVSSTGINHRAKEEAILLNNSEYMKYLRSYKGILYALILSSLAHLEEENFGLYGVEDYKEIHLLEIQRYGSKSARHYERKEEERKIEERKQRRKEYQKKYSAVVVSCPICEKQLKRGSLYKHKKTHS